MSRVSDTVALLRSLQLIADAGAAMQRAEMRAIWANSSLRTTLEEIPAQMRDRQINLREAVEAAADTTSRMSTVISGITEFARYNNPPNIQPKTAKDKKSDHQEYTKASDIYNKTTVKQAQHIPTPPVSETKQTDSQTKFDNINVVKDTRNQGNTHFDIKLTPSDKALLKKLDKQHREKMAKDFNNENIKQFVDAQLREDEENPQIQQGHTVTAVPNPKSLTTTAKQRKVPSSRMGRMVSFGTLAAGLGIGTLAEYTKRSLGIEKDTAGNIFMNKANMERIVDTLCKVRGAALKIGQILSIQDESIVDPELAKALERVRKSADFMPTWQLEKVLIAELGCDWRSKFASFEMEPFAAASIGQVHRACSLDGKPVAVKIQYPGVARSIESDIDNLIGIMKVWNIFPPGMFVDNVVIVAKRELAWEVDYHREAECTRTFRKLVEKYPYYHVPAVYDELSSEQVFTTELVEGVPVDQCINMPAEDRRFIGEKMLELILREIMDFQYMQTDPNWANFLYNSKKKQLLLLDFGASRAYTKKFTDNYVRIIKAAAEGDRNTILTYSRELGFFTGYESKLMEDAHIDAVMILGEVFRGPGEFNFSNQKTTERIQHLVPTMLAHRLCPPPEEIYSLHRKISGVFLLCSKLKVSVNARKIFYDMYDKYRFDY